MNLEELLQQYGEDQRQKAQAATYVRRLARRAAWRWTGVACLLFAMVAGFISFNHTAEPQSEVPLIAKARHSSVGKVPELGEAIIDRVFESARTSNISNSSTVTLSTPMSADTAYFTELSPATDTITIESELPIEQTILPIQPDLLNIELAYADCPAEPTSAHSRLRFSASIGVSFGGSITSITSSADVPEWDMNGIMNDGSIVSVTPQGSLMARVGMNYTVAQNERHQLDIGLGLDGYTIQSEVREIGVNPFDNSINDKTYNSSTQSLYLNLPLVWNTHHRGTDKIGWQYSLTPAHHIISSKPIGIRTLNPWKLNLGFGISLPHRVIRSLSLTANLLPTYQNHEMHEFGIVIGF